MDGEVSVPEARTPEPQFLIQEGNQMTLVPMVHVLNRVGGPAILVTDSEYIGVLAEDYPTDSDDIHVVWGRVPEGHRNNISGYVGALAKDWNIKTVHDWEYILTTLSD